MIARKREFRASVVATGLFTMASVISGCGSDSGSSSTNTAPEILVDSSTVTAFSENAGSTTFDVSLSEKPNIDVVLDLVSRDATEAALGLSSLVFTSTNWDTAQTVTVNGVDDSIVDGNQTFNISVTPDVTSSEKFDSLLAQNISVTAQDDDTAGITIDQSAVTPFSENTGITTFTVVLNSEPLTDVVLDVASNDMTEAVVSLSSLTFTSANWSTPQTVMVSGVDDMLVDGNQAFNIVATPNVLSSSEYASLSAQNIAVTAQDDDTAGITVDQSAVAPFSENSGTTTFTVVLNTEPLTDVVLDVVSNDTTEATVDLANLTFTSGDWSTPQTITVSGVDDLMADGNQTFNIDVSINALTVDTTGYAALTIPSVSVTSSDDDTAGFTVSKTALNTDEDGAPDTFTVVLNTIPSGDVVVNIASTDLTEVDVTVASLTFTSDDWNIAQSVTVEGMDDNLTDGNQISDVTLTVHQKSTADTTGYAALSLPAISTTTADNDTAGFTIIGAPIVTTENGSVQTFTIKPNTQPLTGNAINVAIASLDTTEGTVSPATLSWSDADWTTAKTVTVTPVDDFVVDGNVVYNVELDSATSTETPYQTVAVQTVAVTNSDDDVVGFTILGGPVETIEGGVDKSFTIQPNKQPLPGNAINVSIVSMNVAEGTVSPASLSWSDGDWMTAKNVAVAPIDDLLADGSVAYNVELDPASSTEAEYAALAVEIVSVTNVDNESPNVSSLSPADGVVDLPLAGTTFAVTFDKSMLTTTITTNTTDTSCSGSIQISKDDFATCVQMVSAPTASAGDTVFTLTPLADLKVGVYHVRVTTTAAESVNGWVLGAEFNTTDGLATIPAVGPTVSVNNTNAVALSDFQVRVVLDSTFDWTGFSATGDEVRFYNGANELSYYVESYDQVAQNATYWVKVDSLSANAVTNLTLVPFDAGLSGASSGNATFVFFDDFERVDLGPEWVIGGSGEGTISIDNGVLDLWGNLDGVYLSDRYISTITATYSAIPGMKGTDSFVAAAKMYRETNSDQYWRFAGVSAAASNYATRGLWLVNNDTKTGLINTYVWKTYQITVDDADNITYERGDSLDSLTEQLTATRSPQTDAAPSMAFWYAYAVNNHVKVDWVFVRKYADLNPVVSY